MSSLPSKENIQDAFIFEPKNAAWLSGEQERLDMSDHNVPFGCFGVVPTVLGIVFAVLFAWLAITRLDEAQQLQDKGLKTEAVLQSKTIASNKTSTSFMLDYTFTAADEVLYDGSSLVSEEYFDSVNEGDTIQIVYEVENPTKSGIDGETKPTTDDFKDSIGFVIISILFSIFGLFFIIKYGRLIRRDKKLEQDGILIAAMVNIISKQLYNGSFNLTVQFQFISPITGDTIYNQTKFLGLNHLKGKPLPLAGTKIAVLYSDDQNYRVM